MPIEVRVVSETEFNRWIVEQGGQVASVAPAPAAGQDG
jgi:heme/copper-type cytochrome/quinol oxidase subunit 2